VPLSKPRNNRKGCDGLSWKTFDMFGPQTIEQSQDTDPAGYLEEKRQGWKMALSSIVWGFLLDCFWYMLAYDKKDLEGEEQADKR
ncbi:hypothetical protein GOODEAATRI_002945, partial [Goodea atripinnis]